MASKFAGLPGIAHGEVDVYETTGTGVNSEKQADVAYDLSENENIERIRLDPAASYGQFKGKSLSANAVDFSDSIGKMRNSGYKSAVTEYQSNGSGLADETLQERYDHLLADIRSLEEDFAFLATQQQREETFLHQDAQDFASKIELLRSHLTSLNSALPSSSLQPARSEKAANGATGGNDVRKPAGDFGGDMDLARAVMMEQRLRRLEQAFGSDQDVMTLAGDSSSSLMASVTMLKNQMSLLDKDNLDHIETRMQTFLPKLNQAMEKKSHQTDSELEKKVTEAYALLKRWEETTNTLPGVVDRLVALKALHEQASVFVQLHQEVEDLQQQLSAKVSIMEGYIKLTEESFAQSVTVIKKNMEHLESRLKGAKQ